MFKQFTLCVYSDCFQTVHSEFVFYNIGQLYHLVDICTNLLLESSSNFTLLICSFMLSKTNRISVCLCVCVRIIQCSLHKRSPLHNSNLPVVWSPSLYLLYIDPSKCQPSLCSSHFIPPVSGECCRKVALYLWTLILLLLNI